MCIHRVGAGMEEKGGWLVIWVDILFLVEMSSVIQEWECTKPICASTKSWWVGHIYVHNKDMSSKTLTSRLIKAKVLNEFSLYFQNLCVFAMSWKQSDLENSEMHIIKKNGYILTFTNKLCYYFAVFPSIHFYDMIVDVVKLSSKEETFPLQT